MVMSGQGLLDATDSLVYYSACLAPTFRVECGCTSRGSASLSRASADKRQGSSELPSVGCGEMGLVECRNEGSTTLSTMFYDDMRECRRLTNRIVAARPIPAMAGVRPRGTPDDRRRGAVSCDRRVVAWRYPVYAPGLRLPIPQKNLSPWLAHHHNKFTLRRLSRRTKSPQVARNRPRRF